MSEVNLVNRTCGAMPLSGEIITRKSDVEFSSDIAKEFIKSEAIPTIGRCATLVKELTEAEAALEMMNHQYARRHVELSDASKVWLTDMRQFRMAMDMEFRQATKSLSDMVQYLARPEVVVAINQMRELAAVAERLKALNQDATIERLMDAILAKT